ncbi:Zn(II)2Cys6 transcription factor [Aspergillus stella-maris]|uniref:Zn(II)2Cys6 transcription factor n=1 Tax=Aspergillus stella-maris TaxID=1810926 RepID=UPI003CCD9A20
MVSADDQPSEMETPNKRRKVRKGTTSCWECKRRKVRCSLVDHPDRVCSACHRRGKQCVTQDLPDQTDGQDSVPSPRTASETCIAVPLSPPAIRSTQSSHRQLGISQELYANLPCKEDIDVICKVAAHVPITFCSFITIPYPAIEKDGVNEAAALLEVPTSESHPVIIAKYLLRACMILQSLDFSESGKELTALSAAPQLLTKRLAEAAIRLVTSRDELLGTIEAIECVMMEGSYQANCGNFRPAWIAFRKAMSLAQMMGIHRPDHGQLRFINPSRKINAAFLWHRIVYIDRFVCLMMGLPQGSMDRKMAATNHLDADTPMGRLERLHCVVASRILERNDIRPTSPDDMRKIDRDLQTAADAMPPGWWVVPDSIGRADLTNSHNQTVDWNILRLLNQLYHYGLVNQLHLPFMLRFNDTTQSQLHNYSEAACVNASRGILARYIILRSSNRVAHSCRVVEFLTLSSGFLLLVSHLREHTRSRGELTFNPLAHQRQGDRALVSQAVENLQKVAWISQDRIIANSADLLSRLLDVEAEAAKGRSYTTRSIGTPEEIAHEAENGPPPRDKGLRFCVPYLGFVRITPDGPISMEPSRSTGAIASALPTPDSTRAATHAEQNDNHDLPLATVEPGIESEFHPSYAYPASIGADDWTMQGLDMTFFDFLFQMPNTMGDNGGSAPSGF